MKLFFRLFATVGALLATQVFATLFVPMLLPIPMGVVSSLLSWALSIWVARQVWLQLAAPELSLQTSIGIWGCALGGLGFVLGFFGPMLLAPDANQGPMLGIFITGPGGFLLGAAVGFVRWVRRRDRGEA